MKKDRTAERERERERERDMTKLTVDFRNFNESA